MASRIDMFLIFEHLSDVVKDAHITVGYKSDHSLISISLEVHTVIRGPGVWKMNDTLLANNAVVEELCNVINHIKHKFAESTPEDQWHEIKIASTNCLKEQSKMLA